MMTRFRITVVLRIFLLVLNIGLFSIVFLKTDFVLVPTALALLILMQSAGLIRFIESTNQHFVTFLCSVRQSDFSISPLPTSLGNSFDGLKTAYADLLNDFKESRARTEEKARYLELILMQARVGLIGFNQAGRIDVFNNAAKRYLKCTKLRTIEDLRMKYPQVAIFIEDKKKKPDRILKIEVNGEYLQLAFNASTIHFRNSHHTLVSFHNIQENLETKELEAWHDLIRVLTHEIMNSITPIVSLANTAESILEDEREQDAARKGSDMDKVKLAISTIHKRSQDLHHFVEDYRKLSRLPNPDFETASLSKLFQRVELLMEKEIQIANITFKRYVQPADLHLICDSNMLEQLLINLIKNAIDATKETREARIELRAYRSNTEQIFIELEDNGMGMEPDVIDKVFIPFYSTKNNGSGIGLSLSRQIMRLHSGSLHVKSQVNAYTVFTMKFQ